jgi:hypothetical protein
VYDHPSVVVLAIADGCAHPDIRPLYGSKREFRTRCKEPYSGPRRAERAKQIQPTSQGLVPANNGISRASPWLVPLEALFGQFYLAVVVAQLVGARLSQEP